MKWQQAPGAEWKQWRQWFAWRPVTLTGTTDRVWLEWIERRDVWVPCPPCGEIETEYREQTP